MESPELDAQGKLERKALGNVRRLYERLDSSDKFERSSERGLIIAGCSLAAFVIAALGLSALLEPNPVDRNAGERTRCMLAARDDFVQARKKDLRQQFPEIRPTEMNKLLERAGKSFEPSARARCEITYPKPA